MKLIRKSIGRIATTLLATAMLAGVMSTAAFAEGGVTTMTDTTFTVETTLTVPANVITPALEITYAVETAQASENETRTTASLPVYDGVADGVTATQPAKFNQGTTAQSAETVVNAAPKASFTVNLASFDHAGIYKYKISVSKAEGVNGYEGVTYDATEKYLYVYITNGENGALEVSYVELAKVENGAAGEKSETFEHKYGVDGDGNDILYDLDLQKIVAGDAANMNESFTFPVTITGQTGTTEKFYAVVGTYGADGAFVPGTADPVVLISGETATFTLKHNEVVRIYGLSENDEYALYETEGGKNGYTTTATVNDEATAFVTTTLADGSTNAYALNNENADVTGDVRIVYTNTRNVATPTGVLMDVAPYAAMVALAVAGCFVFLRKRDVEE